MPLPAFAELDDLEASLGAQDDTDKALAALGRVSTAIRALTSNTWVDTDGALVDMDESVADVLRDVTIATAERLLRNPEGATSRTDTLGPFSQSATIDVGGLYFTKIDREQLAWATSQQYPSSGFPGIGTIPVTRGVLETGPLLDCDYVDPDDWPVVR